MDSDRFDDLLRDSRFIPGVYNYCDRWCERCPFTSRCMNYALGEEERSEASRSKDAENEAFWDKLQETLEAAMEMVEEQAEEIDFDIDEEDFEESLREQEEIHEATESQTFCRVARKYIDIVDNWFHANEGLLDRPDVLAGATAHEAVNLHDCLEVIRWYQPQICAKLHRAAGGAIRAEMEDLECLQEDADGSAKVALLGIERSIAAWGTLLRRFPDHEDAIFAVGTLKRLLRQVDAAFPHARAFRRPGFDTGEP
ncbi:MAG: hypothetical protein KBE65_16800 [Phycisphaerae bacterium]|nr:hypothetical protein [Phycisphaerae bacterium]